MAGVSGLIWCISLYPNLALPIFIIIIKNNNNDNDYSHYNNDQNGWLIHREFYFLKFLRVFDQLSLPANKRKVFAKRHINAIDDSRVSLQMCVSWLWKIFHCYFYLSW